MGSGGRPRCVRETELPSEQRRGLRRARCDLKHASHSVHPRGLTFDMSGGGQTAKLAGRRPLEGGVRRSRFEASADVTW